MCLQFSSPSYLFHKLSNNVHTKQKITILCLLILEVLLPVCKSKVCLTPWVQNQFSMQKFAGNWYQIHMSSERKISDRKLALHYRCPVQSFDLQDIEGSYMSKLDFQDSKKKLYHFSDILTLIDPTVAHMVGNFSVFDVLCVDYNHWAVAYSCMNITNEIYDFLYILARNRGVFNKLLNNKKINSCVESQLFRKLKPMYRMKHDSCLKHHK